jgi:GTPase
VGPVVGGRLIAGQILANSHLYDGKVPDLHIQPLFIGPMDHLDGRFIPLRIVSIHRQRRPAKMVRPGQSATFALDGIKREHIRKVLKPPYILNFLIIEKFITKYNILSERMLYFNIWEI